jgi:hypothetical protein
MTQHEKICSMTVDEMTLATLDIIYHQGSGCFWCPVFSTTCKDRQKDDERKCFDLVKEWYEREVE